MPDTPPAYDGIEWLDPTNVDTSSIFSSEGFSKRYPHGPGYLSHLIDKHDESEFAEDVALYSASLMGVRHDYYYTPYEHIDLDEIDKDLDLALKQILKDVSLCIPRENSCSP